MTGPGPLGGDRDAPVRVETSGGVAVVRIDRPKANALSTSVLLALARAFVAIRERPPGAVVLYGGERLFSAGAEVAELADPARAAALLDAFRLACDAIAAVPRATVAAVEGYALGGGLELALCCDLRVVADGARLGQPEVLLGVVPGAGGTQRLTRLVGPARAKDLVLTGRQVDAAEALRIGLADRIAERGEALDAAFALASGLASGARVAQGLAKAAIDGALDGPLEAGLAAERAAMDEALSTRDAAVGMASFLAEGPGKAVFRGE